MMIMIQKWACILHGLLSSMYDTSSLLYSFPITVRHEKGYENGVQNRADLSNYKSSFRTLCSFSEDLIELPTPDENKINFLALEPLLSIQKE